MLDSSILVEYNKVAKTQLLIKLISDADIECFINETVLSEYLYHFVAINGGRSPRATQSARAMGRIFAGTLSYRFIERFSFLQSDQTILTLVPGFMAQYNLLPNDAIILATCKIHGITRLASHDSDFDEACKGEGITLLKEP
jgi:predicted nucleic acid-binding protein